jgi:Tat protein translocase TatB subunit
MFDIGFQELMIIFIVALLVFGPKKLPELAKTMGKWVAEIKRGVYIAKSQIEQELNADFKIPDEDIIKNLPKDIAGTGESKEHQKSEESEEKD